MAATDDASLAWCSTWSIESLKLCMADPTMSMSVLIVPTSDDRESTWPIVVSVRPR